MQSYSIAKVGGLLSGNAHERYRGEGPLIRSVLASDFILEDGRDVIASSPVETELSYAAIGGYGGVCVITEVTLQIVSNEKLQREV